MVNKKYSLPEIDGLLSLPSEEIMKYGLHHDIIDSEGLIMHILLGRILVSHMTKALPKEAEFDKDVALSLSTVYHATRQSADY